ncbi:hypothetical protein [Macromonas bipunctata]|uniref:hypothetical protein n=1 Tax=Macromonas bipunctata TaxID=183670 RepID=UPI00147285A7|nr:hypothetical protein [Macromonas bipunctata]
MTAAPPPSWRSSPAFAELLASALQQLHEGSVARYRLRRSEYLAWQLRLSEQKI